MVNKEIKEILELFDSIEIYNTSSYNIWDELEKNYPNAKSIFLKTLDNLENKDNELKKQLITTQSLKKELSDLRAKFNETNIALGLACNELAMNEKYQFKELPNEIKKKMLERAKEKFNG